MENLQAAESRSPEAKVVFVPKPLRGQLLPPLFFQKLDVFRQHPEKPLPPLFHYLHAIDFPPSRIEIQKPDCRPYSALPHH